MKKEVKLFGFLFWLHLFLIILAYISPFLVDWKIIFVGVFLLLLTHFIFDGCILTHMQFGKDKNMTFYTLYFEKLGFKFSRYKLKILMRYIMPFIVLILAFILQYLFNFNPLLF